MSESPRQIAVLRVSGRPIVAESTPSPLARADDCLSVCTATDGVEALDHLAERPVDCVVSDYDLPDMDGVELFETVRAGDRDLPFVLVAANGSEKVASDAISAGVSEYVGRSPDADQAEALARRIHTLVTDRDAESGTGTRYARAFERAFDAMIIADDDGRYIEANRSACDLLGLTRSELLGRDVSDFVPGTSDFEAVWRQFESAPNDRGIVEVRRDDGQVRTVEYAATANVVPGEHLAVLRDVSDREHREWALREMHSIISDRDRPFVDQVEALLALGRSQLDVDYGTLSAIRGEEYVFEVVDGADEFVQAGDVGPVSATNCEIAATTEQTLVLGDVARDAADETDRAGYAEWGIECYLGTPVYATEGVYGTLCFYDTEPRSDQFSPWEVALVDLMGRWVTYELQRKRRNERLEEKNARLDRFTSVVSHDLRNPLNVLEGSLQLAEETGDAEEFERCHRAVERMQSLIHDLLALARAGEGIDDPERIDLGSFVQRCWQSVETRRATLRIDATTPVRADPSRLQQLFENLIRNSIEHGSESVTITVGDLDEGFYIEDDGPGIPTESRDSVLESGYTTATRGTGFGLAIVAEVADAHGWDVSVTEASGGGARFEFVSTD